MHEEESGSTLLGSAGNLTLALILPDSPSTAVRTTRMNRTSTAVIVALMSSSTTPAAQAPQPYPTKPIRMLVGFTPGSEIDVIGRVVFRGLSERLGHDRDR